MTCIVGLEAAGRVWLGTDSYIGTPECSELLDGPKWFRKHGITCAFAGNVAHAQRLEYAKIRAPKKREDPTEYLVRVWGKALAVDAAGESGFLLSMRGRLYSLQGGGTVARTTAGYMAEGAGAPYALGSFHSTPDLPPRMRIELALGAAVCHSPFATAPLHVIET